MKGHQSGAHSDVQGPRFQGVGTREMGTLYMLLRTSNRVTVQSPALFDFFLKFALILSKIPGL